MGWVTVLVSTSLINHLDLFGLQQAWAYCRGRECPPPKFRTPLFYKWVRHPIYAGVLLMLPGLVLLRPTLTVLIASVATVIWVFIQARLEEMDLIQRIPEYKDYMREVPRFIPRGRR